MLFSPVSTGTRCSGLWPSSVLAARFTLEVHVYGCTCLSELPTSS